MGQSSGRHQGLILPVVRRIGTPFAGEQRRDIIRGDDGEGSAMPLTIRVYSDYV